MNRSMWARKHMKYLRHQEPAKAQDQLRVGGNRADVARKAVLNKLWKTWKVFQTKGFEDYKVESHWSF